MNGRQTKLKTGSDLAKHVNGAPPFNDGNSKKKVPPLSPRQIEIAQLVTLGLSDKEIAGELNLSQETIGWHLKRIFLKWQIHSRTALTNGFLRGNNHARHPPHERGGL